MKVENLWVYATPLHNFPTCTLANSCMHGDTATLNCAVNCMLAHSHCRTARIHVPLGPTRSAPWCWCRFSCEQREWWRRTRSAPQDQSLSASTSDTCNWQEDGNGRGKGECIQSHATSQKINAYPTDSTFHIQHVSYSTPDLDAENLILHTAQLYNNHNYTAIIIILYCGIHALGSCTLSTCTHTCRTQRRPGQTLPPQRGWAWEGRWLAPPEKEKGDRILYLYTSKYNYMSILTSMPLES